MLIKALFALAGMVLLHLLFNAMNFTGLIAILAAFFIPLILWHGYESRNKKDSKIDHLLDLLEMIDVLDLFDFKRK